MYFKDKVGCEKKVNTINSLLSNGHTCEMVAIHEDSPLGCVAVNVDVKEQARAWLAVPTVQLGVQAVVGTEAGLSSFVRLGSRCRHQP